MKNIKIKTKVRISIVSIVFFDTYDVVNENNNIQDIRTYIYLHIRANWLRYGSYVYQL